MADPTPRASTPARPRINWFGLLAGFVLLSVASVGFSGDPGWLFNEATKWMVAVTVALVGLGLLVTAGGRRNR
ncbi:hypothetical protein [Nakamurella leprariae]|uniref:Uncharacterized protein n=1 Tax=Nakamurella leprariae TaxID=2803911 RepID=A0A938Y865_9ACTN|nr:hypothetical protein [Nakamurella leprariae]MBM9467610.1 hypothetical protein [Nakamurella leprariae]